MPFCQAQGRATARWPPAGQREGVFHDLLTASPGAAPSERRATPALRGARTAARRDEADGLRRGGREARARRARGGGLPISPRRRGGRAMRHAGSRAAVCILARSFPGPSAVSVCGAEAGTQKSGCGCPRVGRRGAGWGPASPLSARVRSGAAGRGARRSATRRSATRRGRGSAGGGAAASLRLLRGAGSPRRRAGAELGPHLESRSGGRPHLISLPGGDPAAWRRGARGARGCAGPLSSRGREAVPPPPLSRPEPAEIGGAMHRGGRSAPPLPAGRPPRAACPARPAPLSTAAPERLRPVMRTPRCKAARYTHDVRVLLQGWRLEGPLIESDETQEEPSCNAAPLGVCICL